MAESSWRERCFDDAELARQQDARVQRGGAAGAAAACAHLTAPHALPCAVVWEIAGARQWLNETAGIPLDKLQAGCFRTPASPGHAGCLLLSAGKFPGWPLKHEPVARDRAPGSPLEEPREGCCCCWAPPPRDGCWQVQRLAAG